MQVTSDHPGTFSHADTGTATHYGACIHTREYIQCINQRDISVLRVPPYLRLLGTHLKRTDENHLKSFNTA